jgi:hypothetical protein
MKTFKLYSAALAAAKGGPILRVGKLYIVGIEADDEIALIAGSDAGKSAGTITGHVTASHLDRLGNANWAKSLRPNDWYAFADTQSRIAAIERSIAAIERAIAAVSETSHAS